METIKIILIEKMIYLDVEICDALHCHIQLAKFIYLCPIFPDSPTSPCLTLR